MNCNRTNYDIKVRDIRASRTAAQLLVSPYHGRREVENFLNTNKNALKNFYQEHYDTMMTAFSAMHGSSKTTGRYCLAKIALSALTPSLGWVSTFYGFEQFNDLHWITANYLPGTNPLQLKVFMWDSKPVKKRSGMIEFYRTVDKNGEEKGQQFTMPTGELHPDIPVIIEHAPLQRLSWDKRYIREVLLDEDMSSFSEKEGSLTSEMSTSGPGLYQVTVWDRKTKKIHVDKKIAASEGRAALVKVCLEADLPEGFDIDDENTAISVKQVAQ